MLGVDSTFLDLPTHPFTHPAECLILFLCAVVTLLTFDLNYLLENCAPLVASLIGSVLLRGCDC